MRLARLGKATEVVKGKRAPIKRAASCDVTPQRKGRDSDEATALQDKAGEGRTIERRHKLLSSPPSSLIAASWSNRMIALSLPPLLAVLGEEINPSGRAKRNWIAQ